MSGTFRYSSGGWVNDDVGHDKILSIDLTTTQKIRFDTEEDKAAFGSSRSYRDLFKEQVYKLKRNDAYCRMLKVCVDLNEDVCDRIGFYMWKNSHLRTLTLEGCNLSETRMKKLFSRIVDQHEQNQTNNYLQQHDILEQILNVGGTSLKGRVMDYLAFTPFSKLLHVDLSGNNFGTNGLDVLLKAIAGAPVKELHLMRCGLNDLSPFITGGRKLKELKMLDLASNQLYSTAANARALSVIFDGRHPRQKELGLQRCGIDSELMKMAAPALSSNRTLLYLHLLNNPLDDRGIEALIKAYCNSTSFEKILASNHTIKKITVGDQWSYGTSSASEKKLGHLSYINYHDHGPNTQERSLAACRKLFCLLSFQDDIDPSMFQYFDIGLAPLIFSKLLNSSRYGEKEHLTAIYKILKCKSFRERLKLSSKTNRLQIDHDVLRKTEEETRSKNEQLEADNATLSVENRRLKEQIALLMAQNENGPGDGSMTTGASLNIYNHASKQMTSFDGVRIDAPINEDAARAINDESRVQSYSVSDDHHLQHTKQSRRKNHNASAFAMLEGSGSKRGRRENHSPFAADDIDDPLGLAQEYQGSDRKSKRRNHNTSDLARVGGSGSKRGRRENHSPFAVDDIDDPLELAQERQGSDRKSKRKPNTNFTQQVGSNMNNIMQAKYRHGSMTTNRNRQRKKARAKDEEIDVDSDERIDGSGGKKRKTSNQGDDDFRAEGWESQDVMAALLANEYVQPSQPVRLTVTRDPNKKKQKRSKKRASASPIPSFKMAAMKDELEEYNDNDSTGWLDTSRGGGRTQQQQTYGNTRNKSNKTKMKLVKMGMMDGGDYDTDDEWRAAKSTSLLGLASTKRQIRSRSRSRKTKQILTKMGMQEEEYDTDDEWRAAGSTSSLGFSGTKRQTRSSSRSRKAKKKDEVIEILDSSSEEESSEDDVMSPEGKQSKPKPQRPHIGDLFTIEAARIAVGKKVFKSKCELKFQFGAKDQYMKFCWNNKGKEGSHTVSLNQDSELLWLNYYVAEENSESILTDGVDYPMTMIAFKIKATESNGFVVYTNSFKDDSYVTVEFRDNDQFLAMIEQMKRNETLKTWFDCDNELEFHQVKEYTVALSKDTEKENNLRRSTSLSRAGAKKKGSTSEKPKLVFPFKADEEEFHAAATDLNELKEARESASASAENKMATIQPQYSDLSKRQAENETKKVKGSRNGRGSDSKANSDQTLGSIAGRVKTRAKRRKLGRM